MFSPLSHPREHMKAGQLWAWDQSGPPYTAAATTAARYSALEADVALAATTPAANFHQPSTRDPSSKLCQLSNNLPMSHPFEAASSISHQC